MDAILVNTIVGFWIVIFGAAAIFPMLMERSEPKSTLTDDQVISIVPVAPASSGTVTPLQVRGSQTGDRQAA